MPATFATSSDLVGYAIRVDHKVSSDLSNLGTWLDSFSTQYVVCREGDSTSNVHYHGYALSHSKISAVRVNFKRRFPDHIGNDGYSLKVCDSEVHQYYNYLCKGNSEYELPEIVLRQGLQFDEDWIKSHHDAYWVRNSELSRSSKQRKELAVYGNVVERVELEAKRLKLSGRDREELAKIYIRMYTSAKKPINIFHAKGVINSVSCLLDECNIDVIASEIASRF